MRKLKHILKVLKISQIFKKYDHTGFQFQHYYKNNMISDCMSYLKLSVYEKMYIAGPFLAETNDRINYHNKGMWYSS